MSGLAIVAKGAQTERINKLSHNVKSQNGDLWYSVVEQYGNSIEGTKAADLMPDLINLGFMQITPR